MNVSTKYRLNRSVFWTLASTLCFLGLAACSSSGSASDTTPALNVVAGLGLDPEDSCEGEVVGGTVENLIVDDGTTCMLDGTRITGNLFVYTDATLVARNIWVGGNIQAEGAALVDVGGATIVGGNIQIKQGREARVESVRIGGDLQLEQKSGSLVADGNIIDGNLQVFQNTGGVTLTFNRVAENLQCKENSPAPTGGDNTAGSKEDQCEFL